MIIFFYGEDSFRTRQKVREIKQKYLNSDKSGSGLSVFDCGEAKDVVKGILGTLSTPNLLAPKRLLIVRNSVSMLEAQQQKRLLEHLKSSKDGLSADGNTVLVFEETGMPKKNNALYKFLAKTAKSQELSKLSGAKLNQWVEKSLKEIDPACRISPEAVEKLVLYSGENSAVVFSELEKLAGFSGGGKIEGSDVDLLVKASLSGNIFSMVDALGKNDKVEALRLLHIHLEKGDDPFYIMSMFFYQFRNMLKVADLFASGVRNEYDISRIAKLHPFVVKKSLSQTSRISFSKLKSIYQRLGEMDTAVKTGRMEIRLALDKFVVEL